MLLISFLGLVGMCVFFFPSRRRYTRCALVTGVQTCALPLPIFMDQMELRIAARHAAMRAELMKKEIDHRVMNSLQFISGLLSMQSHSLDLTDAAGALQMAANRVAAVAQVHRNFYADEAEEVTVVGFLRRLCADLSRILDREIEVRGDEGAVPTILVQPIGLITNEFVTNAAKHAAGRIEIIYTIKDGLHELMVCDEGPGLPPDFDPAMQKKSLGMRVLTNLAKQLNGTFAMKAAESGKGACFAITFPVEHQERRKLRSVQ